MEASKAFRAGSVVGFVVGLVLVTVVWGFTGAALVAFGLWAGVVWFWVGVFWLRAVSKQVIRFRYMTLTGKTPPPENTWRDDSREVRRILAERKN